MTTKLPTETYLRYWKEAEAEEFGLCITVVPEDQQKFVNALYECRATFGGFSEMMLAHPHPAGTIFILHKGAELP